jgi:hypothetical protein
MPYCAECGYEYVAGSKVCPDCEATLVEGERLLCKSCEEPITDETTFCPHCGVLRGRFAEASPENADVMCAEHTKTEAVGRCVMCGKPVCEACAHRRQGRFFCPNDEHEKMAFDWVSVRTTNTEYEAEMVKANLVGAGIETTVLSQRDRMFFTTMGDVAVTEVMVRKEKAKDAREILEEIDTREESIDEQK